MTASTARGEWPARAERLLFLLARACFKEPENPHPGVLPEQSPWGGALTEIKAPALTNAIFATCRPMHPIRPCAPTSESR